MWGQVRRGSLIWNTSDGIHIVTFNNNPIKCHSSNNSWITFMRISANRERVARFIVWSWRWHSTYVHLCETYKIITSGLRDSYCFFDFMKIIIEALGHSLQWVSLNTSVSRIVFVFESGSLTAHQSFLYVSQYELNVWVKEKYWFIFNYEVVPRVMSTFILPWNEGIHTKTNDVSKIYASFITFLQNLLPDLYMSASVAES
jgi:hypothetical protein